MKLDVSDDAKSDLKRIRKSISRDNAVAAKKQVAHIRAQFKLLVKHPLVGEAVDYLLPGMRRYSVGTYVIYFRPAREELRIVRVLHGARDAEAQF
jgi:toxin ParE1/3/4